MKTAIRLGLASITLGIAAAACEGGGGKSVPPVAGVVADVGGPNAIQGSGTVPIRLYVTGPVLPDSVVTLSNESRTATPVVKTVGSNSWITIAVAADVGDLLVMDIEPPGEDALRVEREVLPPRIFEIRDVDGTEPWVHAGEPAAVRGDGFSIDPLQDSVLFNGISAPLVTGSNALPHPGSLLFTVPGGILPGRYLVTITVAGTYTSLPFEVELR